MEEPTVLIGEHWSVIARNVAIVAACLMFCIMAAWMVFSKQDAKLYESDNMVCVSQPFSLTCFERKPR